MAHQDPDFDSFLGNDDDLFGETGFDEANCENFMANFAATASEVTAVSAPVGFSLSETVPSAVDQPWPTIGVAPVPHRLTHPRSLAPQSLVEHPQVYLSDPCAGVETSLPTTAEALHRPTAPAGQDTSTASAVLPLQSPDLALPLPVAHPVAVDQGNSFCQPLPGNGRYQASVKQVKPPPVVNLHLPRANTPPNRAFSHSIQQSPARLTPRPTLSNPSDSLAVEPQSNPPSFTVSSPRPGEILGNFLGRTDSHIHAGNFPANSQFASSSHLDPSANGNMLDNIVSFPYDPALLDFSKFEATISSNDWFHEINHAPAFVGHGLTMNPSQMHIRPAGYASHPAQDISLPDGGGDHMNFDFASNHGQAPSPYRPDAHGTLSVSAPLHGRHSAASVVVGQSSVLMPSQMHQSRPVLTLPVISPACLSEAPPPEPQRDSSSPQNPSSCTPLFDAVLAVQLPSSQANSVRQAALEHIQSSVQHMVLDEMPVMQYDSVSSARAASVVAPPSSRRSQVAGRLASLSPSQKAKELALETTRAEIIRARNNDAARQCRQRRDAYYRTQRVKIADTIIEREFWKARCISLGGMPDDFARADDAAKRALVPSDEEFRLLDEDSKHEQQHGARRDDHRKRRRELMAQRMEGRTEGWTEGRPTKRVKK